MTPSSELPELSDGAFELLLIADENDDEDVMANNLAIILALALGEQLILACHSGSIEHVLKLVQLESRPRCFLAFVSAALCHIQSKLDEHFSQEQRGFIVPVLTDFNLYVLQGFAHALADLCWQERDAQDFDGPSFSKCVTRLAQHDVQDIWFLIIQHYLANILQHYFSAARIRESVKDLAPETEVELRRQDARMLADYVLCRAAEKETGVGEPRKVMEALQETLVGILVEGDEE